MNFAQQQDKILNDIIESYKSNILVPFVGAGFSKNAGTSIPDWNEFILNLYNDLPNYKNKIEKLFGKGNYNTDAAEFYGIAKFREQEKNAEFNLDHAKRAVLNGIDTVLKKCKHDINSSIPHKLLVKMFPIIYTTNWDTLIENAIQFFCNGYQCLSISSLSDFSTISNKERVVVKIHGSVDRNYRDMIVTTKDYLDLLHNKHKNYPLNVKFQAESFHKDFLFIGYGFGDPNVNNILYPTIDFKKLVKENKRTRSFTIIFDEPDEIQYEYYKEYKDVDVYFINSSENKKDATTEFLLKLIKAKLEFLQARLGECDDDGQINEILIRGEYVFDAVPKNYTKNAILCFITKEKEEVTNQIEQLKNKGGENGSRIFR